MQTEPIELAGLFQKTMWLPAVPEKILAVNFQKSHWRALLQKRPVVRGAPSDTSAQNL